jgi:hypothetical protein
LGTVGVLFGHTFGKTNFPFFLGRLKWGFVGTLIDFLLVGRLKGGTVLVFFPPIFWADSKGDYLEPFFSLFFWHNFLISYKGTHLRDLFQGLGLPLFGLRAHLTKFLVALIGPFWCTLKLLGTLECFVL